MSKNAIAESKQIAFRCVTDRRERAILIDLGEEKPVWFRLQDIAIDEQNQIPPDLVVKT
jgi:hypothetical protein